MGVNCTCSCNSNRFNSLPEIVEFLNSEVEVLNLKLTENEIGLVNLDILKKKEIIENNITIRNVSNILVELSHFLKRVDDKDNRVVEILNDVQIEVIEPYYSIKKKNFPTLVIYLQ